MHHSGCQNRPLLLFWCLYVYFQLNVIQQPSVCVQTSLSVDICFRRKANHLSDCAEGSEEKNCNITVKTVSAVVCWSWHCWVCCSAAIAVSLSTGSLVVPTQSYLSVGVCVCDSCHCCECDMHCMYAPFLLCRDACHNTAYLKRLQPQGVATKLPLLPFPSCLTSFNPGSAV